MSTRVDARASLTAATVRPKPDVVGDRLTDRPRRTAILVTGMHRNGTSALARTLSLIGAALPDDLVPANDGNPGGHWEPRGMVELNDRMLADAGSDLYSVIDIRPEWFASAAAATFTSEASRLVERSFQDETLILLKDPRTALLAPIWNAALIAGGYRVVHVLPLRHPSDVAESLRRRHLKDFPYDAWVQPRGEAVWLRYMLAAVRGSRGQDRVFLHYGDLLKDWRREVDRIGRDLGIVWPRLHPEAEAEVDAFLHVNDRGNGAPATVEADPDALSDLDLSQLASACFAELVEHGDDGTGIDAIQAEFETRISGTRDLVSMLEGLYPLVWHHFEFGRTLRRQLDAAIAVEGDLRVMNQRHWAALTSANDERRNLQLALGSRDRQVVSLHEAITRLDQRVVSSHDDAERMTADHTCPTGAVVKAEADRGRPRADEVELRGLLEVTRQEAAALAIQLSELRSSTSWRITRPLRALVRAVRRRP